MTTLRRFLLAVLMLGLAVALWQATRKSRGPGSDTATTETAAVPVDPDLEFAFLEEAHYQLWLREWTPSKASPGPPDFKFLIRMISESIVVEDDDWMVNAPNDPRTGEPDGGLLLIMGSGQTVVESADESAAGETK
jgi:hypothetical protein